MLRAVPLCVPRLVPLPASPRHQCRCRPIASRYPPRFIDTTGGEIRRGRGGSLGSACLSSPSHPCGSASDGDGVRVLASLHDHHRCRLLTARSPNQISSPSCRPAAPSSHRLSPRSLDTGDGAEVLLVLAACLPARSLFPFRFLLRSICAGSVEDDVCWLSCLLGCCIFIYVDGVMW